MGGAIPDTHQSVLGMLVDRAVGKHLEKARNAVATAFELEPDLPQAHLRFG